ncbi:MAG: Holliday junction resolvase RuvX [Patescibacteria group bacterium]|nr:Holliday junction resolvase RuvX [Patescibacteria group bacterium]
MAYLGLDVGKKRIGVAISTSGIISQPYLTIQNKNEAQVLDEIVSICYKEKVKKIIIGIPYLENNAENEQVKYINKFISNLKTKINIPIFTIDEFLTSKEAERLIKLSGQKEISKKDREKIDQKSAQLILEEYLNYHINEQNK